MDPVEMLLEVGATGLLTATVVPENATNKRVTWSSSDTNVATVANGVVNSHSVRQGDNHGYFSFK